MNSWQIKKDYVALIKFSEFSLETLQNLEEVMECYEREEFYKFREKIGEVIEKYYDSERK